MSEDTASGCANSSETSEQPPVGVCCILWRASSTLIMGKLRRFSRIRTAMRLRADGRATSAAELTSADQEGSAIRYQFEGHQRAVSAVRTT